MEPNVTREQKDEKATKVSHNVLFKMGLSLSYLLHKQCASHRAVVVEIKLPYMRQRQRGLSVPSLHGVSLTNTSRSPTSCSLNTVGILGVYPWGASIGCRRVATSWVVMSNGMMRSKLTVSANVADACLEEPDKECIAFHYPASCCKGDDLQRGWMS